MQTTILAHDLGTSSCKSILALPSGEVLAATATPYPLYAPQPGWAEQDAEDWWAAVCGGSRAVLEQAGVAPDEVAAVSFAGQMQCTLPVDAEGQPLGRAMIWLDARAEPQSKAITRGVPSVAGYGLARLARWIWLTNGVPTQGGRDPVAKMLWLREERPELWAAAHKLLDAKDFLLHRATGRYATSFDCGNSSWLMDTRPGRLGWSPRLLAALGIPEERLPELVPGTATVGGLTAEAAAAMGLPIGVPVIAGAGDVAAMAVGTGAVREHEVHLGLGTSAWLATHVRGRRRDLRGYMASICSAEPGPDGQRQLLVAHQETGGACVEWLRRGLGRAVAAEGQDASYKDLDAVVERTPPGAEGVMFLPWLAGEYAPVDDPWARASFVNLGLAHGPEHLVRAVYEGVGLNARWALSRFEGLLGAPVQRLQFAGGGAASEVWCQVLADTLGRPVVQADRPPLAAARGAALIAARGLGLAPDFDSLADRVAPRTTSTTAGSGNIPKSSSWPEGCKV